MKELMKELINIAFMLLALCVGIYTGYKYPRDVEIESTKPVVFSYEVTKDAAQFLILKDVKGCDKGTEY